MPLRLCNITERLATEIKVPVGQADNAFVGNYIARQTLFCGRWIRHGGVYPDYNLRLLRRGLGRFEDRLVHEHIILDGAAGYFKNHLIHDDDKGFERYVGAITTIHRWKRWKSCGYVKGSDRPTWVAICRRPDRRAGGGSRISPSAGYRCGRSACSFICMC